MLYNIYFELAAVFFLSILLFYIQLQYNTKGDRNRAFFNLLLFIFLADILDVISAVCISYASHIPIWINMVCNTVYLATDAVLGYYFLIYALHFNKGKKNEQTTRICNRIHRVLLRIYLSLLIVNLFTGLIFSFDRDGRYLHGTLYLSVYLVPFIFFISSGLFLLKSLKYYKRQQQIAILTYLLVCFSGPLLQLLFFPNVLLSIFTIALASIIMIFSMETPEYQKLITTIQELEAAKDEAMEARQKAQIANEAKSSFLANMSHEIRTPITAVLGMDEMILREATDKEILEYAKNIQQAGNTLLSLINDILDFSKIESGKMEIIPVDYQLSNLLNDCYNMTAARAKGKNLDFRYQIEPSIPNNLYGDEIRIRQLLINLLTNAIKYTPSGSVFLKVDFKQTGEKELSLQISIEDTGIGISEENIKRLFNSFERFDVKKNRSVEGSGLGLTITRQLLERMGGRIIVTSELDKGSCFQAIIPQKILSPETIGNFVPGAVSVAQGNYKEKFTAPDARILIVDDTPLNLRVIQALLKSTQMQIDTASSGKECLDLIVGNRYDLIFMDHMMPEMDGIETLSHIRSFEGNPNQNIPVIVLTANAISGASNNYLSAGFNDYLSKPAKGADLEAIILKHLPRELIR